MTSKAIVLHIAGVDRPGITSSLTGIIADEGAELVDIGQSCLHGYLTLSAIVGIPEGSDALRKILFAVAQLGLRLEVSALREDSVVGAAASNEAKSGDQRESLVVSLLGNLTDGRAVAQTTQFLASQKANIRDIRTLTTGALTGLELTVDLPSESNLRGQTLRQEILDLSTKLQADIAVQKDDLFRRNKRLLCMDVDSTFVQFEVIDELARLHGCGEKVATITERAMRGELDFKTALKERVVCLKGLKLETAKKLLDNIPLTPGAEDLVSTMKALGVAVGLVSGGFDFFVDHLKKKFQLDFAFSNQLEVKDGTLTGQVTGTIVDAERKAQVLRDMSQVFHCRTEQTIAVGDGANDMQMLQAAGLGIAFHAKLRLQAIADLSLNASRLDGLLLLMGFHARELSGLMT